MANAYIWNDRKQIKVSPANSQISFYISNKIQALLQEDFPFLLVLLNYAWPFNSTTLSAAAAELQSNSVKAPKKGRGLALLYQE